MDSIPYGKQNITVEDIQSVVDTLRGAMITQGEKVPEFENQICKIVEAPYAVAVNSATSALHLACMAIGVGKNDWVWTSSTSFVASANCGLYCKAKVDFIDIENETGLIDPKKLSKKLKEAESTNKLPKVIVVVHLAGTSCEMRTIDQLAKRYGIKIIEDASHAIGGKYENYPVGSCMYSDITVFSFHPVKIITTGEGGMATTKSKEYANKMLLLRSHGIEKDKERFIGKGKEGWKYEQQYLGMNYRMTDIQAALGISQAARLREIIDERNRIYARYEQEFLRRQIPVKLLNIPKNIRSALHLCIIRLTDSDSKKHEELFKYMRENGVGVQIHYSPIHLQPYYKDMGFKVGDLPNSELYEKQCMSIPLYPGLKRSEQDKVIELLETFLRRNE